MKYVSKILISCGDRYIFSIKKTVRSPQKDNRMELFGGNADPGETAFEGLIRELIEEETSGILAANAEKLSHDPISSFVIEEKMQCIFHMEIDEADLPNLKADPEESYGIRTLPKRMFETPERLNPDDFTPKTIKIFKHLKII